MSSNIDIDDKVLAILDEASNNTTSKNPLVHIVWLIDGIRIHQMTNGERGNSIHDVKKYVISNILRLPKEN